MYMKQTDKLIEDICQILKQYQNSFKNKEEQQEKNENDLLMDIFDITPEIKKQNRQYWGRELGMIWQKIVIRVFQYGCPELFKPTHKIGKDEPYDLQVGNLAIDTKYRIGSGDAGTLKKFKQYAKLLKSMDLIPMILILRTDNLPAAITACQRGGWEVLQGNEAFNFIEEKSGIDLNYLLKDLAYPLK